MAGCDYLNFLVAAGSDARIGAALRAAAPTLHTAGDLVRFAARYGYRFTEDEVPLAAAQEPGCRAAYGGGALV